MQIYILDAEYNRIGMIDEAESVLWRKKYNDIGDSEIYIPCDAEYLDLLKRGHYLFRYDDDMVCKIMKRDIETDVEGGDYLIVPATDLCTILAGRIVRWQVVYSGTVAGFIEKVLTDNVINPEQTARKIPCFRFEIDTSNGATFTEQINVSTFAEDLLQLIITTCKTYNYGFRLTYDIDERTLVFRLYRGKNKALPTGAEYVEFSPQYSNILSTHYSEDESEYKNVAYVSYKAADGSVHLLSVYRGMDDGQPEPTGEARREIYVDGTNTSRDITLEELKQMFGTLGETLTVEEYTATVEGKQEKRRNYRAEGVTVATSIITEKEEDGETVSDEKITVTDYTYLLLIRALGDNALAEHVEKTEFGGAVDTIDTYEYKADYNLGDVVRVINEHGISAEARISEVLESDDDENGYVVEPTFEFNN